MSSTCFEPEVLSSGRRLCIQVWYIGRGRNNSHILKVNKNQTKQRKKKILLFM